MALEVEQRAVGIFTRRSDIELALVDLKNANYPMHKVSIVARNAEHESEIAGVEVKEHTGNKADEGAAVGAATGGTVGGLTGLLIGLGLMAIPTIGPIMLAGAGATAIATALAGGAIGAAAGSLGGALVGLGIPEDEAKIYSDLVDQGYYLVMVDGNEQEIIIAEQILRKRGIRDWGIYQASTPLKSRYKNAAGLLFNRQNVEQALTQLKDTGFSMNQVSVVSSGALLNEEFEHVNLYSRDDWDSLGVPKDIRDTYQYRMNLGDYLIAISGTELEIAAARNILEASNVKEFHVYSPAVVQAV
ncbi:hypothetical protein NIES4101_51440 [Calothrix sp. NIES-4101]|nr:hypothetical protein NIES4101_51440 [Calothrix sp. NIES-4101]